MMLRYFMYCRKSTEEDDRQVLSNESQKAELEPIATRDRLVVCDRLEEAASAKLGGTRPVFMELVKRIKRGEANAILCWHPNRLSRNATDAATLVDLMDQGRLLEICTPGQVFRNTPGDKFLLTLFCSQAKLENDNKGVDVKRGLRAKVHLGWYPGVAPMGYLNDKTKNPGERELVNDPERFALVKRMWQLMLSGNYTPPQILRLANEEWGFRTRRTKKQGGNPLSISALYHIFHNPFYYGWFEYPSGSGLLHEGKHEPMVTKEEFDRVQALLGRAGNPRPSQHRHLPFTGLIRCGACAGMITAEEKQQIMCGECRFKFVYRNRDTCPRCKVAVRDMTKPLFLHYTYYHCSKRSKAKCKQRSVEARELEKQIEDQLGHIQVSANFKKWAFKYMYEIHAEETNAARHVNRTRDKAYDDCLKRLENLVRLKTSPENADGSLLSDAEYSKQRQELLQEKAKFGDSPHDDKLQAEEALRRSEAAFEFAHSARSKFAQGDFQMKKEILATIGSNLILTDKKLIIEAKQPFFMLNKFMSANQIENTRIEPKKQRSTEPRFPSIDTSLHTMLRDVKDVRTRHIYQTLVQSVYSYFRGDGNSERFKPPSIENIVSPEQQQNHEN